MQREIVLTISPGGETTVTVEGHRGPGCRELTRVLEADLGRTVADRATPEFRQTQPQAQQNRENRRWR